MVVDFYRRPEQNATAVLRELKPLMNCLTILKATESLSGQSNRHYQVVQLG